MSGAQPVLDRILDFICLLPPQSLIQKLGLSSEISGWVCLGVLGGAGFFLVLALVSLAMPQKKNIALALAALITAPGLAWLAANFEDRLTPGLYVYIFITLRGIQGLVIGLGLRRIKLFWLGPLVLALALGLATYLEDRLPPETGPGLMGLWVITAAVMAGYGLSKRLGRKKFKALAAPLVWAVLSVIFLAPVAFVPQGAVDATIHQYIFPATLLLGLISARKNKAPVLVVPPAGAGAAGAG